VYSTCLFCRRSLGANEVVEAFPIGRRLAFDSAKGRLWVVCRGCERWNLTPLDERWVAIEDCERRFRDTKLRVSTDNIGLARLKEGLELVRIGKPMPPELAVWRYGDQFGRRRRRHRLYGTAGTAAVIAASFGLQPLGDSSIIGSALFGAIGGVVISVATEIAFRVRLGQPALRVRNDEGHLITLARRDVRQTTILRSGSESEWAVEFPFRRWLHPTLTTSEYRGHAARVTRLTGDAAHQALRLIVPRFNGAGGSEEQVATAVRRLEERGPMRNPVHSMLFDQAPSRARRHSASFAFLRFLPLETRLALEMALNEDLERRAFEGELALLEHAWREAEEIAAIADALPEG